MPQLPLWYSRVPEILQRLRSPGMPPLIDRDAIEELFHLSRRQAIRLLGVARGYQVGKTFIIERQALIDYLERLEQSGVAPAARARKQRVALALREVANHAAAQKVEIRTDPSALRRQPADLGAAIQRVGPGRLQILYKDAEDLLARVVELAAAAANDFPAFRQRYEGHE